MKWKKLGKIFDPTKFDLPSGCAEFARSEGLNTRIFAVDAVGSAIFGDKKARRLIPGIFSPRRTRM